MEGRNRQTSGARGIWRPTVAEIDLGAIRFNLRRVAEKVSPASVMAVVKADGYGHGAIEVARTALAAGAACLGVATLEEALELRDAEISAPILIFGGFIEGQAAILSRRELQTTVCAQSQAEKLSREATAIDAVVDVHVKVDTGMRRMGVDWREAAELVGEIDGLPGLELSGIYTHFASADSADKTFARTQLQRFRRVLSKVTAAGVSIPLKHAANSAAILDLPESTFDLVRLGISMYGSYPSDETSESIELRPAMALKSRVAHVKNVGAGETVGYGRAYTAQSETRIALAPIGYADGYNRRLSNRAQALIRGQRFPLAGRVSMDQIAVDVGMDVSVAPDDEVVLFGAQGEEEIKVSELCQTLETIPYEIFTSVSKRVPRIYHGGELPDRN